MHFNNIYHKIWDLNLNSSVATISSSSNEIWAFSIIPSKNLILIGNNTDQILIVKIDFSYDSISKKSKVF